MKALEISVTIGEYGKKVSVSGHGGEKLIDILNRAGITYNLPCGGAGTCGGCRVRFLNGAPEPGEYDKRFLSAKEISDGVRLLCRSVISEDCEIELGKRADDTGMAIETVQTNLSKSSKSDYGVAIDLGTTTIAAALIASSGDTYEVIETSSCVNRQRKFGNDVISRIAAAEDSAAALELKRLVAEDIGNLIKELSYKTGISCNGDAGIKNITIAGNTTMLHLLMGEDVTGLGKYPYTPVFLETQRMASERIFDDIRGIDLTMLPGISAFVGADIVSGLFSIKPKDSEKFFFLDLGTNGEMAFFDGEKLKVTSAAAGPVFEAGGISCGAASVPGAISHAVITSSRAVKFETIGGTEPVGICGTGVMELTSELLRNGIIDETGLLAEEYFDEGFPVTEDGSIRFTQQDIRNVQLAKAAIFTGSTALLAGSVPDKVYIAGGFGNSIDPEKIAKLKMFPAAFDGKIVSVGNSALRGAAEFSACALRGEKSRSGAITGLESIKNRAQVIELAAVDSFDEAYIEAMNF